MGKGVAQAGVGSSTVGRNVRYPASWHGLRQQEGSQLMSPSAGARNWALCSPNSKVGWDNHPIGKFGLAPPSGSPGQ